MNKDFLVFEEDEPAVVPLLNESPQPRNGSGFGDGSDVPSDYSLLDEYSRTVVSASERVAPGVVNIEIQQRSKNRSRHRAGSRSGFIITPDGAILTNSHAIPGATQIVVTLSDGRARPSDA